MFRLQYDIMLLNVPQEKQSMRFIFLIFIYVSLLGLRAAQAENVYDHQEHQNLIMAVAVNLLEV